MAKISGGVKKSRFLASSSAKKVLLTAAKVGPAQNWSKFNMGVKPDIFKFTRETERKWWWETKKIAKCWAVRRKPVTTPPTRTTTTQKWIGQNWSHNRVEMHSFLQKRRLQEKLTVKLMGANFDTRGFLLLLPSLSIGNIPGLGAALLHWASSVFARPNYNASCCCIRMHQGVQLRRKSAGVGVCSPRLAGHGEFCKYLPDGLAVNGAGPRRCTAGCDPCIREDPGQEN